MNKGLEALKELKERYGKNFSIQDDQRTHVIEEELKRLGEENKSLKENFENLDETYFDTWCACEELKKNSNYALMFVDNIYCLVNTKDNKFDVIDNYELNNKGIIDNGTQKKLKAFEIIKEKDVGVAWFIYCCKKYDGSALFVYNNLENAKQLTQEEFDLLKEVLS